jgi:hypothetical protein
MRPHEIDGTIPWLKDEDGKVVGYRANNSVDYALDGSPLDREVLTPMPSLGRPPFAKKLLGEVPTIAGAVHGWWSGPVVFRQTNEYGDNSFIGAADQYGHLITLLFDHDSGAYRRRNIAKWEPDDHNVPAFVQRLDKRVIVAYARHALEAAIRYRISDTANCDDWGTEQTLVTSDDATYVQMFRQSSAIHMFYRLGASGGGSWAYRRSTDNGATWTTERNIIDTEYVLVVPTSDGSAFRCFCYENPTSGTDHDIYYLTINSATGEMRANGAQITGSANAFTGVGCPVAMSAVQKAVDVASATISTRLMGAALASTPVMLAVEFTSASTTDGALYRYTYSAANVVFTRKKVCDVGVPFATATQYHGGACFDPSSVNIVYVARNDGAGVWTIDKYETANAGDTWTKTTLYTGSKKLARPIPFADSQVMFSEFDTYLSFEDFTNGVLRVVSR